MHTAEIEIDNEVCYISVTQFGDTNFVTISDTGTFGSFYQVEKKEKMGNEPIFQIQPIFGQAEDYLQVRYPRTSVQFWKTSFESNENQPTSSLRKSHYVGGLASYRMDIVQRSRSELYQRALLDGRKNDF